tara:strand:- start:854 stop:982 length:129 start_codon:yes stop_codon:yes gene_type:complete
MEPSFLALPKKYSKFSARFLKAVIWKKNQTKSDNLRSEGDCL